MQTNLVGDLILSAREAWTDPCQNLSAPTNVAALVSGGASTTNFYFKVTQLTPWGESAPAAEVSVLNAILTGTITVSGNCSYAATAIKIYFTIVASGAEDRFIQSAIPTGGQGAFSISFTLSSVFPTIGFPPLRSSAWLPDTDGTALSAFSIYRWINEGLDAAAVITEGIRDITGIPSTGGVAQYQPIGNWRKLSNGFYDGYPFSFGNKFDVFRHANVTGITGTMVMNSDSQVQQVEIWPQASRTAGAGTLSGSLSATATQFTFTPGATGFQLGFGLALLGPYPTDLSLCEIVYYNTQVGNVLGPLTRGMGGTIPQAWPTATPVTELNIFLSGLRIPFHYSIGQSANLLNLPPAWIDAIRVYLEYRFKKSEQDVQEAQSLLKEFEAKCQSIKGNRLVMGPRQISIGGASGVETVVGAGGYFGGVILP